jgi:hypothetical protein
MPTTTAPLSRAQADALLDLIDVSRDAARAAHTATWDDPRQSDLLRADSAAYDAVMQAVLALAD